MNDGVDLFGVGFVVAREQCAKAHRDGAIRVIKQGIIRWTILLDSLGQNLLLFCPSRDHSGEVCSKTLDRSPDPQAQRDRTVTEHVR